MHVGHIQGGTNAGWRIVNAQVKDDWTCQSCGKSLRYYWVSCPIDGTRRPERES